MEVEAGIGEALNRIWNGRMAGEVYSLYLYNAELILGVNRRIYGRENILSRIVEIHSMLPDLSFSVEESFGGMGRYGEDLLYLRWVLEGSHLGPGIYGEPTGRYLKLKGMSLITLRQGMIARQLDVINDGDLPEQLGLDEEETELLLEHLAPELPAFDPVRFGESGRVLGQNPPGPEGRAFHPAQGDAQPGDPAFFEGLLKTIWNWRSPGIISRTHHPDALFTLPGSGELLGSGDYTEFVFSMAAAFPDLSICIDEVISGVDGHCNGAAAVCCTLQGFHEKSGPYGEATGRQVTIPMIIEYHVETGKVKTETLFMSEFELMVHLYTYRRIQKRAAMTVSDPQ